MVIARRYGVGGAVALRRVAVVVVLDGRGDGPDGLDAPTVPLDEPVGVAERVTAQHRPRHERRGGHLLVGHAVEKLRKRMVGQALRSAAPVVDHAERKRRH